jgi:hypothetical protein
VPPITPHVHTRMLRGCPPQCRQSSQCAASSRPCLETSYAIIPSRLLPSEAARGRFHFDDGEGLAKCVGRGGETGTNKRTNAHTNQMRKVEFQLGSIRSSFVCGKEVFGWIRPSSFSPSPLRSPRACTTTKPTTQLYLSSYSLAVSTPVLGCSHQVPGPPFFFSFSI